VRTLGQSNLRKFASLQDKNAEYHRQRREILDRVHELCKEEKRLMPLRIDDTTVNQSLALEGRLNGLVFAAAAVKDQPVDRLENLLCMIWSATGDQSRVAESVEVVETPLRNIAERAGTTLSR
jgi:hypothetical protein